MKILCVALILSCAGCAHTDLPPMRGNTLAPGMVSMEPLVAPTASTEPWEPSLLYPALSSAAAPAASTASVATDGPMQATAWLWFRAYQSTLSRVDGTTCRFRPTCSGFGVEAIQHHGLLGLPMTFGRLHKSHAAERHYPMTNPPYLDDPVSNYGFTARRPRLDDFAAYTDEAHAWYQHVRATRRVR